MSCTMGDSIRAAIAILADSGLIIGLRWPFFRRLGIEIWKDCRDWRTLLLFAAVNIAMFSEVWVPYAIGGVYLLLGRGDIAGALFGSATTLWVAIWLPLPYWPMAIGATFGIKAVIKRIEKGRKR